MVPCVYVPYLGRYHWYVVPVVPRCVHTLIIIEHVLSIVNS